VKNQFLGIFFYLLYLLAMVKPLVPIIEYYANYDYIVTELCENKDKPYLECNGKCYLEKQLKKTDHKNHEHKLTIPSINFDDYPVSPLDQFAYQVLITEHVNDKISLCLQDRQQEYLFSILRPPQV